MSDEKPQITAGQPPVLKGGKYQLTVTLKDSDPKNPIIGTIERSFSFTVSGEPPEPENTLPAPQSSKNAATARALTTSASIRAKPQKNPLPPAGGTNPKTISTLACTRANIQSIFPPAGSLGDHSDVLPHLSLNRSTLPWEHRAVPKRTDIPWLALLLFDEQESPEIKIKKLDELKMDPVVFPDFKLGPGQHWDDQVTVIDVQRDLFVKIPLCGEDLKHLAHVRRGPGSEAAAVIVCSQLPKRGSTSIVHLVSLEGRYLENGEFDYQGYTAANTPPIRLLSLYSWHFACQDKQQNFTNLLLNLNAGTLRLPENSNLDAERYLAMGCAPLRHITRLGDQTISWYHGPLLPGENRAQAADLLSCPIRVSDQLVRFNPELSVFDVSYAAAWELGRFLGLQSKAFSIGLFQWKESYVRRGQESKRELPYLPFGTSVPAPQLPLNVKTWLERVEYLEGIPFNYLVPDERMLPPGSIRFFYLDWLWLECLQKGALSLGRSTKSIDDLIASLAQPSRQITGFLLHSEVVAGWPGLLVDGYLLLDDPGGAIFKKITATGIPDELKRVFQERGVSLPETLSLKCLDDHTWEVRDQPGNQSWYTISSDATFLSIKLPRLRMDYLAKDILICLFDGKPDAVDFRLKPEGMNFRVPGQAQGKRSINIKEWAKGTKTDGRFISAPATSQMFEREEKVRLKLV